MVTEESKASRPGSTKNFTISIPATRKRRIVATIDMPPPRAIVERWYLSSVGRATKPMRVVRFLTSQVRMADAANDATSRIIARYVSVTFSIAPVNGFGLLIRNAGSRTACSQGTYIQNVASCFFHT